MSNKDEEGDKSPPLACADLSEFDDAEWFRKWEEESGALPDVSEPVPDIDEFDEAVFLPSDEFDDAAWFRRWDEPGCGSRPDIEEFDESVFLPPCEFEDAEWFARWDDVDDEIPFDMQEVDSRVLLQSCEFEDAKWFRDWAKMDHLASLIEREEVLAILPLSQKDALMALISSMAPRQLLELRRVLADFASLSECDSTTENMFRELELIFGAFAPYYLYAVGEVLYSLIQSRRLPAYHG